MFHKDIIIIIIIISLIVLHVCVYDTFDIPTTYLLHVFIVPSVNSDFLVIVSCDSAHFHISDYFEVD